MRNRNVYLAAVSAMALALLVSGCSKVSAKNDEKSGAGPEPVKVEQQMNIDNFAVDHPERYPVATAIEYSSAPELNATGVVSPDVSRQVPVASLASGRVVEIDARLGDEVQKGQLLFRLRSADIAGAFSDYRQAVKNELLAKVQLDRAKILFENGAAPRSALDVAQNAKDDAQVVRETTLEHLRVLGADPDHPSGTVEIYAPVSGTITDQQITMSSGVQALSTPNPFTISDLSRVWIVCDVWENDMAQVHIGEFADIHLTAYPDRVLKAKIANILPVLDPSIRTAKVRLEIDNPGILRLGMFVTATFHGIKQEKHAAIPAAAIVHLHDREWVYEPLGANRFRRAEIRAGNMLPGSRQEVVSGLEPGDRVVSNALEFQNTVEQ